MRYVSTALIGLAAFLATAAGAQDLFAPVARINGQVYHQF